MYFWNLSAIRSLDCRMVCAVSRFRRLSTFDAGDADLEQAEHREHERNDRKREQAMDARTDLLHRANEPAGVEIVHQQAGEQNAVALEPVRQLQIQRLELGGVVDEPAADGPEAPGDQAHEHGHHDERHDERREQRHKRGHSGLQGALQRPYDGDDEERECDRGEDRAREIERRKHQHRGAEAEHDQCGPAGHAGLVRSSVRQRRVVMF